MISRCLFITLLLRVITCYYVLIRDITLLLHCYDIDVTLLLLVINCYHLLLRVINLLLYCYYRVITVLLRVLNVLVRCITLLIHC